MKFDRYVITSRNVKIGAEHGAGVIYETPVLISDKQITRVYFLVLGARSAASTWDVPWLRETLQE